MNGFWVVIHLNAKGPPCKRMIRVARDLDRSSLFDLYQKPAGVRAIIRANRPFYLFLQEKSPLSPFILTPLKYMRHLCLLQPPDCKSPLFTIFISVDLSTRIT
jgi:hypothetical protein